MKKFLIAILFLIPVVVVLAIQGAGTAISAWAGEKINAVRIDIRDEYNDDASEGRVIIPRYNSGNSDEDGFVYIYINVYPKVAYSDEVAYKTDAGSEYSGKCELERVEGNKYRLVAKANGTVLMSVYSITNDNAYKTLNIYITSDKITDFEVYSDEDGEMLKVDGSWSEYKLTKPTKFYSYAQPLEAIGDNLVSWSVADEAIATVDKNGLVTPTGRRGKTRVTAQINDKTGETHFFDFYAVVDYDEREMFITRTELSLSQSKIDSLDEAQLKKLIWDAAVSAGAECAYDYTDIELVSEDDGIIHFSLDGKEINVRIVDADEIVFNTAYLYEIYMENGGYYLEVGYADISKKGSPDVRFEVSDPSILAIEEGLIKPTGEGTVSIVAVDKDTGKSTEPLNITVKKRVSSFQLTLNAFDNSKGILMERKWGEFFFDGEGQLTNSFKLGYDAKSVFPDASNFDLIWESMSPDYAAVDDEGTITFSPLSRGQNIVVSATVLVHGIKTNLSRTYTFSMAERESVNAYSFDEMMRAYSDEIGKKAVCIQSDIEWQYTGSVHPTNSLYGNGFLINICYSGNRMDYKYWSALMVDGEYLNPDIKDITIENFTIQGAESIEEELVGNNIEYYNVNIPAAVRGVISRYAWTSISLCRPFDVLIESNIMGQTNYCGLYISDDSKPSLADFGTVTVRNNVFRESSCSAIGTAGNNNELSRTEDDNYVSNIKIEGFNDSYNWKKISELGKMFSAVNPSLGSGVDTEEAKKAFEDLLAMVLSALIKSHPQYEEIVYKDGQDEWICMGLFALGLNRYIDPEAFTIDSDAFVMFGIGLPPVFQSLIKGTNLKHPCYCMSYTFDAENGPDILPKDACPENEALFLKLLGREAK